LIRLRQREVPVEDGLRAVELDPLIGEFELEIALLDLPQRVDDVFAEAALREGYDHALRLAFESVAEQIDVGRLPRHDVVHLVGGRHPVSYAPKNFLATRCSNWRERGSFEYFSSMRFAALFAIALSVDSSMVVR
jgi:hypothetical protein